MTRSTYSHASKTHLEGRYLEAFESTGAPRDEGAEVLNDRKRTAFGTSLVTGASFLLFIAGLSWFRVQYQTNDDAGMNMFALGKGLAQHPSEFLLFQHFLIGLVLKNLYVHFPSLPWYGAFLYLYLFLSSIVIGYAITRLNPRHVVLGFWIMMLILFYVPAIVSPQFTVCAGFVGVAGLVLLYSSIFRPHASSTINVGLLVLASGLIVLSSLIRYQVTLLIALLMAPLFVHLVVTRFATVWRRLLFLLSGVGIICVLFYASQRLYYQHDAGWRQFFVYNQARADFTDRARVLWSEQTRPLFQQIGWSENDLAMIQNWVYLDRKRYSLDNLLFLSRNTPVVPRHKIVWREILGELKGSFLSYSGLGILLLSFCLVARGSRIVRILAVLALVWYCGLFIGVSIVEKSVPLRVWMVMLCGLGGVELVLWSQVCEQPRPGGGGEKRQRLGTTMAALGVLGVIIGLSWGEIREASDLSRQNRIAEQRLKEDLARLQPRAEQLFVVVAAVFPYEAFQLPLSAAPVAKDMQLLGLGVGNHEPFVQNRLKSFGIEDLYQSLYTRDDVFLIGNDGVNALLIRYVEEHYDTKVKIITLFQGTTFKVSKVRRL